MARNFKTPKKARTTYKVYDAYDRVVAEFIPGQDGVTEVLIQQLHAADDDEFDANRREAYHIPVHYMAYTSGDAEEAEDRNSYLADEAADCTGAAQPPGDLGNPVRIRDHTGGCQHHVVIYIVTFKSGQRTTPSGDIGECDALLRNGGRRLFGHVDSIVGAFYTVPFKPIVHAILSPFPRCWRLVSVAISTARERMSCSSRITICAT